MVYYRKLYYSIVYRKRDVAMLANIDKGRLGAAAGVAGLEAGDGGR